MNQTKGRDEDAPEPRNAHDLRLTALLFDMVEARGRRNAAATLGVSYSALARAARSPPRPMAERVVARQPEPDELAKLLAERDLLELQIEMIGVCGLTLPPLGYPWDRVKLEYETLRRQLWMFGVGSSIESKAKNESASFC